VTVTIIGVPTNSAGIRGGINRLIPALEQDLTSRGVEIRRSTTVRRISRTADGYELETGPVPAPRLEHADAVIVATPATPAARMLADLVPTASAELATIDYASMAIVTLAVRKRDWPATASGSGFLVPSVEGHTIKASTYSFAKWQWSAEAGGDLAVLRCSVGRLGEEHVLQRSDDELVALATADLRKAIGLEAPVVGSLVTRWGGGLPQYAVGHLDRIDRVEAAVAEQPGLTVCGAAYRGVGIAACVAAGSKAATRVRAHLDALATMAP
jgi:oxygen-dependent protoporphyrinogen oxidase